CPVASHGIRKVAFVVVGFGGIPLGVLEITLREPSSRSTSYSARHGPQLVFPRHRRIGEVHDCLRVPAVDELARPGLRYGESRSGRGGVAVLAGPRRAGLRDAG